MRTALFAAVLMICAPAWAEEFGHDCETSPLRTDACVAVHGRMTSCTAVPSIRIWIVGTKRILGVADAKGDVAGETLMPSWLEDKLSEKGPCARQALGDFIICPLEQDRPGVMRKVCLAKVKHVRVKPF